MLLRRYRSIYILLFSAFHLFMMWKMVASPSSHSPYWTSTFCTIIERCFLKWQWPVCIPTICFNWVRVKGIHKPIARWCVPLGEISLCGPFIQCNFYYLFRFSIKRFWLVSCSAAPGTHINLMFVLAPSWYSIFLLASSEYLLDTFRNLFLSQGSGNAGPGLLAKYLILLHIRSLFRWSTKPIMNASVLPHYRIIGSIGISKRLPYRLSRFYDLKQLMLNHCNMVV